MLATKRKPAFTLVEVLLAIAIFTLFSGAAVTLSMDTINRDTKIEIQNEALRYAQEGLEAARAIRSQYYWDLVTGEWGLSFSDDKWSFVETPETIDGFFNRTIIIEDVYRDSFGNIASMGTLDPNTKKITSVVEWSWRGILPYSVSLETLLSNWTGDSWLQTTCSEWTAGFFSSTETRNTAGPPDNNCALMLEIIEGPGNFFASADVGSHGNDVDVDGNYAYMATGKSEEGLAIIDISDVANPIELEGMEIGGKGRAVLKVGDIVYVGVEKNSKGLAIIDVTNPNEPELETTFDIGGYGNRMDISGTNLFIGVESSSSSMKIVDVSNPASPSTLATLNLGTPVNVVKTSGNYAFVGTDNTSGGFQVIDISNPASPTQVYSLNVGGAVSGIDINGGYAYVGVLNAANAFKVVSISDPLSPDVLNSLDFGAKIQDVKVEGEYVYVALDQMEPGMGAVNISETPNVSIAYTRDIEGKGTSVETNGSYVFMTLDVSNMGLVIVDASSGSLAPSGQYESSVLDTGSEDIRYNYLDAEAVVAPGGSVTFQVRTASTSGGVSYATWVGPDGTPGTYYEPVPTPIVLDSSASGKRYIQVKVYLTSDQTNSSEVESITINYTP